MKNFNLLLISALLLFAIFACEKGEDKSIKEGVATKSTKVTIQTAKGDIEILMFTKDAPNTVRNFIKLVNKGFYDGLTFHRIVKGFVVQGGDPRGDGTGGPGYTIKFETTARKHLEGSVAMARKKSLDSAGSQFYLCLVPQPHLDGKYAVFGKVTNGMDVVKKLERGDIMEKVFVSSK